LRDRNIHDILFIELVSAAAPACSITNTPRLFRLNNTELHGVEVLKASVQRWRK
jgi:hypothetical protein